MYEKPELYAGDPAVVSAPRFMAGEHSLQGATGKVTAVSRSAGMAQVLLAGATRSVPMPLDILFLEIVDLEALIDRVSAHSGIARTWSPETKFPDYQAYRKRLDGREAPTMMKT